MRRIRGEWKVAILLSVVCALPAMAACSSDPEGGGPESIRFGNNSGFVASNYTYRR